MPQPLTDFRVYGKPSESELAALAEADRFREALVKLFHQRHRAEIDLRNELFPELLEALAASNRLSILIADCRTRIKTLHSKERDRNALTQPLRDELAGLQAERRQMNAKARDARAAWTAHRRAFKAWWKGLCEWKHVKSLAKRRDLYAASEPPAEVVKYAAFFKRFDLAKRDLASEFADKVHSATRTEIEEATKPKRGKDGPGTLYEYARPPRPKPWRKLILQFGGGLPYDAALAGEHRQLVLAIKYINHHEQRSDETVYRVRQQIGTRAAPCLVEYQFKAHREFPKGCTLQRWSLVIRGDKRYVIPLLKESLSKPQGDGLLTYKLAWTPRREGVLICEFRGAHVHEELILPWPLLERRMALADAEAIVDKAANEALTERGRMPLPGQRQGLDALIRYVEGFPDDLAAANLLENLNDRRELGKRISQRAARSIEDIYKVVAARVCRQHAIVRHDRIDLAKRKLYDERDLLAQNAPGRTARVLLHAAAPGKLRLWIKTYGLAVASDEESAASPAENTLAASSDLFTTWLKKLGEKTGAKPNRPNRRSRGRTLTKAS